MAPFGGSAEQPVLAAGVERADSVLRPVAVDRQIPTLNVERRFTPVTSQVFHGLIQGSLSGYLRLDLASQVLSFLSNRWLLLARHQALAVACFFRGARSLRVC